MTFGLIVGNRGFFPDHLAKTGREEMIAAVEKFGHKAVVLGAEESKHGAVETYDEALRCASLFKRHREEIDGVVAVAEHRGASESRRGTAASCDPIESTERWKSGPFRTAN